MESSAPETTTQAEVPETAEAELGRWYIKNNLFDKNASDKEETPVWELSNSQLLFAMMELEGHRHKYMKVLTEVFGANAKTFANLAEQESESAEERAREMLKALPANKLATFNKMMLQGGTVAASELDVINKKLDEVLAADSSKELAKVLKDSVTKLGNHPSPHTMSLQQLGALMQLTAGYQLAIDKGWDIAQTSDFLSKAVEAWEKNKPQQTSQTSTAARGDDFGRNDGHST